MTPEQLERAVGLYANDLMIETQRRIFSEANLAIAQARIRELEAAALERGKEPEA